MYQYLLQQYRLRWRVLGCVAVVGTAYVELRWVVLLRYATRTHGRHGLLVGLLDLRLIFPSPWKQALGVFVPRLEA